MKTQNAPCEKWATIPDFDGRYEVSSEGRIYDNKLMKFFIINKVPGKYPFIRLYKNKTTYTYPLHRLMVWAFYGVLSTRQRQVNHIDGQKHNNVLANLEIVTPRENLLHARRLGLNIGKKSKFNRED